MVLDGPSSGLKHYFMRMVVYFPPRDKTASRWTWIYRRVSLPGWASVPIPIRRWGWSASPVEWPECHTT